jgi:hypothetical protein
VSLESELKRWFNSHAGQARVKEEGKKARAAGKVFGSGLSADKTSEYYEGQLVALIRDYCMAAGFEFGDYLELLDTKYNEKTDQYEVQLKFDPDKIHRPSLYPVKYPEGAYDIVALMEHGYDAKDNVYGWWHGRMTFSWAYREGAHFIRNAIEDFNERFKGQAEAFMDDKYDLEIID